MANELFLAFHYFSVPEDKSEKPDPERGPIRDAFYNPTYGYELYWYDGDWVLDPVTTRKPSLVRERKPSNCGLKCGIVYETYGRICGRTRDFKYKSFKNLCEMKSEDCEKIHEWKAIYPGECRHPTILYRDKARLRPPGYINRLFKEYPVTFAHVGRNIGFPGALTYRTNP